MLGDGRERVMKRRKPEVPRANPLIADSAIETVIRCQHVATYVMLTAPGYADQGSSAAASDGLSLIMEALVEALDNAVSEIDAGRAK